VLVTHNVHAIATLCDRALCLDKGRLVGDGPAHDVIEAYLTRNAPRTEAGERCWPDPADAPGGEHVRLRAVRIASAGRVTSSVDVAVPLQIEVEYWNALAGATIYTSIHLHDQSGVAVCASANFPTLNLGTDEWWDKPQPAGLYRSVCTVPGHLLNESRYSVSIFIVTNMARHDVVLHQAISFQTYDRNPHREYRGTLAGVVRPLFDWKTEHLHDAGDQQTQRSALTGSSARVVR
jgi:lipopolysaccharide transport system ATP-binding protein